MADKKPTDAPVAQERSHRPKTRCHYKDCKQWATQGAWCDEHAPSCNQCDKPRAPGNLYCRAHQDEVDQENQEIVKERRQEMQDVLRG